ncbi:1-acyl-sn-glycerol-3-phosphate acyltransferase [Thalassotalea crassostreae]|uniref:1-acyl-sn-glycerol-3-phosphate acyltransferase n=1 Tax=Thalassotalea crassostreae TaxID=1763536 RepID=UPI001D05042D|nr:1-acyl-sn-glycerol-3-phosphate acyltransferase [Thalassotalea crassostreae]
MDKDIIESRVPELPNSIPRTGGNISRWFGLKLMSLFGWKITGNFPNKKKMILAVAPHTSNWDFVIGVVVKMALNLKLNFLGKHSIFFWPFSLWLKAIGGIPIDRRKSSGVVGQLVEYFNSKETLVLALAPEGTRSKVSEWKTGFLTVANQANVDVVPVALDFTNKQVVFFSARKISDDIDGELEAFKALFDSKWAKFPQKF